MKKEEKKEVNTLKVLTKEKSKAKSLTKDYGRSWVENMSAEEYVAWKDFLSLYE